ncbi:cysteine-rich secretory protein LCCL domain-containing 2-like [Syngnathus typhle]
MSDDTTLNILCSSTATDLGTDGSMKMRCPPGCAQAGQKVYGTRLYKQDSNICVAAIHSGVIENEIGGDVTLLKRLPQKAYKGSTCNGITSTVYNLDPFPSFTFADMAPGHTWTGLNDLVNRGRFVWSHRQKVTFTNWAPGEPARLFLFF